MSAVNRAGEQMTPLSEACAGLGISEAEVLAHKVYAGDAGESSVVVVLKSGRKLRWPVDPQTTLVLRQMELEREDNAAAATIAAHRQEIEQLEEQRKAIAAERHRLTLEFQTGAASNVDAPLQP